MNGEKKKKERIKSFITSFPSDSSEIKGPLVL